MTMVERVARAMAQRQMEADQGRAEAGGCVDFYLPWAREHVRANIAMMCEPTEAMVYAGADELRSDRRNDFVTSGEIVVCVWSLMIDAALKEKP